MAELKPIEPPLRLCGESPAPMTDRYGALLGVGDRVELLNAVSVMPAGTRGVVQSVQTTACNNPFAIVQDRRGETFDWCLVCIPQDLEKHASGSR